MFKILFIIVLFPVLAFSSRKKVLLYDVYKEAARTNIGNRSQINPISLYFNAAFDTIQNPTYFTQKDIWKNHDVVWQRVKDPFKGIRDGGGLKKLLSDEFFGKRAAPNYTLHLIGGGHDFRLLYEYYQENGYSFPFAFSFVTQYLGHFANEAVEASNKTFIGAHDHIADLYFFDLAGIFLFMNDNVTTYFRDKMFLELWTFQPMFDGEHIQNAALNYVVRPYRDDHKISFFSFNGMQTLLGASLKTKKGFYSFGVGPAYIDPLNNIAKLAVGLFYDVDNNLMSSLFFNTTDNYKVRLNLHPGSMSFARDFGLFSAYRDNKDFLIGINYKLPVGIVGLLK